MKRRTTLLLLTFLCSLARLHVSPCYSATQPASVSWSRQLSTVLNDFAGGVGTDGMGGVYLTGLYINDRFSPESHENLFLSKYNSAGVPQWTRLVDTGSSEAGYDVSADALGNVFVTGYTRGNLSGQNQGSDDAILMNYDPAGNRKWAVQFGSRGFDEGSGVAADGMGNAYVTGTSLGDWFLRKYNADGGLLWSHLVSTRASDQGYDVAVDRLGGVFIAGATAGSHGRPNNGLYDAFVSKFDTDGKLQWNRQFGTLGNDRAVGVAGDGLDNVYISGTTDSDLAGTSAGGSDAFLAKYDGSGNLLWIRQFGTPGHDGAGGVTADPAGNVYVSGGVPGQDLPGPTTGTGGIYLSKFDPSGTLLWTRQFSGQFDAGGHQSVDGMGGIYVSGFTQGAISNDPILFKLIDPGFLVPEPSGTALVIAACFSMLLGRPRRAE